MLSNLHAFRGRQIFAWLVTLHVPIVMAVSVYKLLAGSRQGRSAWLLCLLAVLPMQVFMYLTISCRLHRVFGNQTSLIKAAFFFAYGAVAGAFHFSHGVGSMSADFPGHMAVFCSLFWTFYDFWYCSVQAVKVDDSALVRGSALPDFAAVSHHGRKITRSGLLRKQGPLVMIFSHDTRCKKCIEQLAELVDLWPQLQERRATVVVAMNVNVKRLMRVADAVKAPFIFVRDTDDLLATKWGVNPDHWQTDRRQSITSLENFQQIPLSPTAIVARGDGKVVYVKRSDSDERTKATKLLAVVKSLALYEDTTRSVPLRVKPTPFHTISTTVAHVVGRRSPRSSERRNRKHKHHDHKLLEQQPSFPRSQSLR